MLKYLNFRPVQVIIKGEFKSNPCPLCLLIKASVIAYDKVKTELRRRRNKSI